MFVTLQKIILNWLHRGNLRFFSLKVVSCKICKSELFVSMNPKVLPCKLGMTAIPVYGCHIQRKVYHMHATTTKLDFCEHLTNVKIMQIKSRKKLLTHI